MLKLLVFVLAAAVYLTPLYPIYAQTTVAPARPKPATTSAKPKPLMERAENAIVRMEDKMATRAAELRAKLQKFRDKNKAGRVENINTNLTAVNKKSTDQMQAHLDRISGIVAKVKTWIAEQESAGKDMASAKAELAAIEGDWSAASNAVAAQAENDYTIVVNTEATVKTDAQATRNKLRTDLKTVHDQVVDIRQGLAGLFSSWKGGN